MFLLRGDWKESRIMSREQLLRIVEGVFLLSRLIQSDNFIDSLSSIQYTKS